MGPEVIQILDCLSTPRLYVYAHKVRLCKLSQEESLTLRISSAMFPLGQIWWIVALARDLLLPRIPLYKVLCCEFCQEVRFQSACAFGSMFLQPRTCTLSTQDCRRSPLWRASVKACSSDAICLSRTMLTWTPMIAIQCMVSPAFTTRFIVVTHINAAIADSRYHYP